jgi:YesN/AraC family two-component response regulator
LNIWEDEEKYYLKAGETLILSPGVRHGGIDTYPKNTSFYWVHFALTDASPRASMLKLAFPKRAFLRNSERLVELFRLFLDDQESGLLTSFRGSLLVLQMLSELSESEHEDVRPNSNNNVIMNRAEQFIRVHFHEEIGTSYIARQLNCNPNYLSRIFHASHGESLTCYLHKRRIHYARNLLLNSNYNMKEIAFECGFKYPNYFNRLFKRYQGMTPNAFRQLFVRMHVNAEQ